MADATISIVSYCQKKLLDRCLAQLETLGLPTTWEIIVVDNNSLDGSPDMVAERYPWVDLIRLEDNYGFARGHNTAYARTNSPVFIVLNPDVTVLAGSLETLIKTLEEFPKAAIVGPCLLKPDGSPQFSARRFYNWWTVVCRRLPMPGRKKVHDHHLMKNHNLNELLSVDWVLGAAMAIRRTAFNRKDLFDPRYRLYFEDVDLCYFARKANFDVLYCPSSKMIHDHQRASGQSILNRAKLEHFISWLKFYRKSEGWFESK